MSASGIRMSMRALCVALALTGASGCGGGGAISIPQPVVNSSNSEQLVRAPAQAALSGETPSEQVKAGITAQASPAGASSRAVPPLSAVRVTANSLTNQLRPAVGAAALAAAPASAQSGYSETVLTSGPLAYYRLNDSNATLIDAGPHGINGTYGNRVVRMVAPITATTNGAAGFPTGTSYTSGGYAYTRSDGVLQPRTLTLEAWIRFTRANAARAASPVVVYGNQGDSYGLYVEGTGRGTDELFYQQSNVGTAGRFLFHGLTSLSPNLIYHIVVAFNGSAITSYVNGLVDHTLVFPGWIGYTRNEAIGLQIGGEAPKSAVGGDASFPGTIDEVAVYGSALSAQTIVDHYLAGQLLPLLSERAVRADAFVDSIGVNTHFYNASALYMRQFSRVKALLAQSGIRHFRDNLSTASTFVSAVKQLAAVNLHGSYVTTPNESKAVIEGYPALVWPSLEAFEGPNEADDQGQSNWEAGCISFQRQLYSWVKNDPRTAGYPVLGPGLAFVSNFRYIGNQSAYMDYGNFHDYMGAYNPGFPGGPYGGIAAMKADEQVASGTKPVMSTETGYGTISGGNEVDYPTDLRYMTRLFFEQFMAGISRSYSYEFLDEATTEYPFATFGLVTNTLVPKPAYSGIKSLIAALQDPGISFSTGSLSYSLSGLSNIHHLLMQKRDGTFILAVWIEAPDWNADAAGGEIAVPEQRVTLRIGRSFPSARLSTMDESGNFSTAYLSVNSGAATFNVSDRVSLVTLTP